MNTLKAGMNIWMEGGQTLINDEVILRKGLKMMMVGVVGSRMAEN